MATGHMHVPHGGGDAVMAEQPLQGGQIHPAFHRMRGKGMVVLISILPMKGRRSPFIIITIRFMENTARSFAGYDGIRVIKLSLSSVMKCR